MKTVTGIKNLLGINGFCTTLSRVQIPPSPPKKNRDFDTMGIKVTVLNFCLFYWLFQLL
jgi:hypothetical protein